MAELKVLHSTVDPSVNFVIPAGGGYYEARYVRRSPDYFVTYLSSQSGCGQGCRMCHLTTTKQTQTTNATYTDYREQAMAVLKHYATQPTAKNVHFNFMARGEALVNPQLLEDGDNTLNLLGRLAVHRQLVPRFLISTIMPRSLHGKDLGEMFPLSAPEFYYSVYSVDPAFRKKWLPNALPVDEAMDMLLEYQKRKRVLLKLHWAFIKGENDNGTDVAAIAEHVWKRKLRCDINIVRYNPPNGQSEETDEFGLQANVKLLRTMLPDSRVDIIKRVGFDVQASCGMFVPKAQPAYWEVSEGEHSKWMLAKHLSDGPEHECDPDVYRTATLVDNSKVMVKFWRAA